MFKIKVEDLNHALSNHHNFFINFFEKAQFSPVDNNNVFEYFTQLHIEIRNFLHALSLHDLQKHNHYIIFNESSNDSVIKKESTRYLSSDYRMIPFYFKFFDLKITKDNIDSIINFSDNIQLGFFSAQQYFDFISSLNPDIHNNYFPNFSVDKFILSSQFLSSLEKFSPTDKISFYNNLLYLLFSNNTFYGNQNPIKSIITLLITDLEKNDLLLSFKNTHSLSYLNISSHMDEQFILNIFKNHDPVIAEYSFNHFLVRNQFKNLQFSDDFLHEIFSYPLSKSCYEYIFFSILENKQEKFYSSLIKFLVEDSTLTANIIAKFNSLFNSSNSKAQDPYFYLHFLKTINTPLNLLPNINVNEGSLHQFITNESIENINKLFKLNIQFITNFINEMPLFLDIKGKSYCGDITYGTNQAKIPVKILEKNEKNQKIFLIIDNIHDNNLIFEIPITRQSILVNLLVGKFYDYFIFFFNDTEKSYQRDFFYEKNPIFTYPCAQQYRELLLHYRLRTDIDNKDSKPKKKI